MAYYHPPDSIESLDGLEAAIEDIQDITMNNRKSCVVLAGDFNAKDIHWDTLTVSPNSNNKTVCNRIINAVSEGQFHQLRLEPTRGDAVLDLFCVNNPSLVKCIQTIPGIYDHDGIILADMWLRAQINNDQCLSGLRPTGSH